MDQGEETSVTPLLTIELRATESNCDYISRRSNWALLDFSGANNSEAIANLLLLCSSHTGLGSVCGQTALSAHTSQQLLMGFGHNPENAYQAL